MKKLLRDNSLSLVLALCFAGFWALQSWAGFRTDQRERSDHGEPGVTYGEYLQGGHFWQSTGENWESEFLQMGLYVFLTSFLLQRGSAESKDPDESETCDEPVLDHAQDPDAPAALRKGRLARVLYSYSLSIAFLLLFFVSFALHAWGGFREHQSEAVRHGKDPGTFADFFTGAEFWFQSMQNWQSEFLAVFAIVTLSIYLRHHGSPESKPVWAPHHKTGKE
jgi:hypothetical protein